MNQYIYFSSKGNYSQNDTADSDFSVNFSNPIVIPPYAEIRCVNCRVNPNNNTYAVKEGQNDKLAFAVGKFWIDESSGVYDDIYNNAFPLFSIVLDEGIYDLASGTDPKFYLNAQIESKINEQITNIPNLRGGVSVSVDSNKILTIKVSPMGGNGFYGIPDAVDLPTALVEKLKRINRRTTSLSGNNFQGYNNLQRVELAPFNIEAEAPLADIIPPNQLGSYDITTDTLVGVFQVGDLVSIVNQTIHAKVLAVNANAPTKIELFSPSDLWKTDKSPANVSINKIGNAGISCRITEWTTTGPDWRGVTLYSSPVPNTSTIIQRSGYFLSPPINWNSLGDWETTPSEQFKLVSTFSIYLEKYEAQNTKTTFNAIYSCFADSLKGMDCGATTAGLGAGFASGAVAPWNHLDANGDPILLSYPEENNGDPLTECEDNAELYPYLFRCHIEFEDDIGRLNLKMKTKDGQPQWGWMGYKNSVGNVDVDEIDIEANDSYLCIETYVSPAVGTNAMLMQIVVKTKEGADDWEERISVRNMYPNYFGFHQLCDEGALDSKVNKPANIRFAYAHNAPNGFNAQPANQNYTQPGDIYWAGAFNPIDEADGFVDGQFRGADYITSQAVNLPSNLPVSVFGDDSIGATDKLVIANENPNDGTVVDWEGLGDDRLRESGANAGVILGLEEQGWQSINSNSNTNGIVFSGNVNANERDFPMHFLDLPDLALNNHTGTCNGTGRPNKFVCPLDLNSGAGTNNIHSSQNETLIYNDLGNAMEERITNLRIRICDLEGTPSINLQNYTVGCLEIRENPQMKQMKMQKALEADREALQYQSGVRPSQFNRVQ